MIVLGKRLNEGWKEKSASNSTSGSKLNAGLWKDVLYACMPVCLEKVLFDAVDWRCNEEGKN